MGGCCSSEDKTIEQDEDLKATLEFEDANPGCCCVICNCLCGLSECCARITGLKCCCCSFGHGKPMLSIERKRICTDVPCCLLFLAALVLQFYAFTLSIDQGSDPRWLVYYSDWEGNLCAPDITLSGLASSVNITFGEAQGTAGAYAAWPDIRMYDIVICVDDCAYTNTDIRMVTPPLDSNTTEAVDEVIDTGQLAGYTTVNIFNAYCIPDVDAVQNIVDTTIKQSVTIFNTNLDGLQDTLSLAFGDLVTCWRLLLISCFTALVISFIWGWLIRLIGGIIIWGSIVATILAMVLIAWAMIQYSAVAYAFGYDTVGDILLYGGYTVAVVAILFAIAICVMWNRIRMAIALAKETTRAMTDLWSLFLYPILPFVFVAGYCAYWLFTAAFMGSVLDHTLVDFPEGYKIPYYKYGPTLYKSLGKPEQLIEKTINEDWKNVLLYHFFMFLWMMNFVTYHTFMVIAGVYAEWYFADWNTKKERGKSRGPKESQLSRLPVCNSFWRTTIWHLGSLAFGSLLIAIIEFCDYTLTYFEKQFLAKEPSPIKKFLICAIRCVLKCMKCILDRINRNGYIIVAIYGWPFCAASMKGISIIFKNMLRAAALDMVSGYLQKLGRVCIISLNTGLITLVAVYWYDELLFSPINPAVAAFGITFFVCWQYMHLFEVGLSTIFICFLLDEERNKNTGFMKASKKLRRIIGDTQPTRANVVTKLKSSRHLGRKTKEQLAFVTEHDQMTEREQHIFSGLDDDDDDQSHDSMTLSDQRPTARGGEEIQMSQL